MRRKGNTMADRRRTDNVIYVEGSEETRRENERRRFGRRRTRAGIAVAVIVLMVLVLVGVYVYLKMRTYKGIKVVDSAETLYDSNAE
jgi:hypothetical protein